MATSAANPASSRDGNTAIGATEGTAEVLDDGRIHLDLPSGLDDASTSTPLSGASSFSGAPDWEHCPPLQVRLFTHGPLTRQIVVFLVGSRGDVQPYISLGQRLIAHGHRVRIATHGRFADFVRGHGLEFASIGGDPEALLAFAVQNPGLIPS